MKRLFTVLMVALLLVASTVIGVHAEENESKIVEEKDGTSYVLDADGTMHLFFDSQGNRVSAYDALERLSLNNTVNTAVQSVDPNNMESLRGNPTASVYSSNSMNGTRTKVTPDWAGPCTITSGVSITTTSAWSVTGGLNISLTNAIKNLVKAAINANGTYNESSSSTSSFSGTYNVPSGKIGAIYFTPYLTNYGVYYLDEYYNLTMLSVKTPKKVNGFTDGLYELVLRNA